MKMKCHEWYKYWLYNLTKQIVEKNNSLLGSTFYIKRRNDKIQPYDYINNLERQ